MIEPVVYEVTAKVRSEFRKGYEHFMMDRHISDLLDTGHFLSASFETSEDGKYRARYVAASREALDSYLNNDAPRLRDKFTSSFPEGVELSREEWTILRKY